MKFRQDINILRGISVLLVVVFHFFTSILPYGYLGVDVFFILSGFLISLGILKDRQLHRFSYANFYKRRVHRILPASLVMLIIVTFCQFFILLPSDLMKYFSSLEATLFFGANIYFFFTGGYFGGNDAVKPLLHMWSLGIEEQFYLIFPLLFMVSLKLITKKNAYLFFILAIFAISYLLNIYLYQIGGANPAFFLLPTRLWQFLVGVTAAFILHQRKGETYGFPFFSMIGLILVFINIFYIPESLPEATILSLGIFVIILNSLRIADNMLTRTLSFFGKISYSLYIWHWPIAAFLNYLNIGKVPLWQSILGVIGCVMVSYWSWKYIEERYRKPVNTKKLLMGISIIYVALISVSFVVKKNQGLPQRFTPEINEIAEAVDSNFRCPKLGSFLYGGSKACIIETTGNGVEIAVLGNSHALMYAPTVAIAKRKDVLVVPINNCTPTYDINLNSLCLTQFKQNLTAVCEDERISEVVIGTTWNNRRMINNNKEEVEVSNIRFNNSLLKTIKALEKSGKTVYLIGPIVTPESGFNFPSNLSRSLAFSSSRKKIKEKQSIEKIDSQFTEDITFWQNILGNKFIPTYESFCDDEYCYYKRKGITYFADSAHLSSQGAKETVKLFEESFEQGQ